MNTEFYDIIVIGAGPAGMAAALAASEKAAESRIALIEREECIGGILKQCIHDGFGLIRFKERLTGPEYAQRYRDKLSACTNIDIFISTFVTHIQKQKEDGFELEFINPVKGAFKLKCRALISATGCRERTDRQIFIHGDRPSGVFTAGQAQAFINLKGFLPGKRCVILGSGDIGLIMARRLTLESAASGGSVEGVYEVKDEPSGLTRNIVQCLQDYGIPLHLSTTVTRLHGEERLEGVTVTRVDKNMRPIAGTERFIPCDTLILSVGLIPENDILDELHPDMDERTKGPKVNQFMETSIKGLFSCGNALHVNDLVDYVSESGRIAGERAAAFEAETSAKSADEIPVIADKSLLYQVPSRIKTGENAICYFRSSENSEHAKLIIRSDDKIIFERKYAFLKPPEMERFELKASLIPKGTKELFFTLEEEP
ncbi:FAD-dependent oxidoreductase [Treponema sp. HNW]|uniref:NAD(P)/FAD-dependent oxidoreductase n=1 Tax=Treponema sp. HNW TaxID=3116654 RepID=UPI003D13786B